VGPTRSHTATPAGGRFHFPPEKCEQLVAHLDESATRAAAPPLRDRSSGALLESPRPTRWTLKRLLGWARDALGVDCCREALRTTLHSLGMSWKKGKRLLARACPIARQAFARRLKRLLNRAVTGRETLVFIDEAHVHQDADLGRTWSRRGERYYVSSSSPGLSARVTFFGAFVYADACVHIWPAERGNSETTIDMLHALREAYPDARLRIIWDGAAYHRSLTVAAEARMLGITLERLPGYSPDFMPVEALWRWLREEVTYNHCHNSPEELVTAVRDFEADVNSDRQALFDRLQVRRSVDPREEELRIS
jgi:transposase